MKSLIFDIKTTVKVGLCSILEKLTQRGNRKEQADLDDCDNGTCISTQFLRIQNRQLIDLQEHLQRYCNVLHMFGFNSSKYDLRLKKSSLLAVLVNQRNTELTVIKKTKQVIWFKYGDFQLLDTLNFLGGTTSPYFFLQLQGMKNFRDKRSLPLRLHWSSRRNAEYKTSPARCFLQ